MSPKPNFLIVGAAKSGTTSLFEYLRQHPQIYMPPCKEISFFAGKPEHDTISFDEYLAFFRHANHDQRIGEASTAYLFASDAPKKIVETLGSKTKIIIMLRNPIDMSYSLWGHNTKNRCENLPFYEAFTLQNSRLADKEFIERAKTWPYNYAYFDRGVYAPQVKRYFDKFGRTNTKVLIFEHFFQNVKESLLDIYSFLGVQQHCNITEFKKFNAAGKVRSRLLHKFYHEEHILTNTIKKLTPSPTRRALIRWIHALNTAHSTLKPLNQETREKVRSKFQNSIEELELLLEIDLKGIWK